MKKMKKTRIRTMLSKEEDFRTKTRTWNCKRRSI